jgi:hypothetical protein
MLYNGTITLCAFNKYSTRQQYSSTVYAQVNGPFVKADDLYVNSCAVKFKLRRIVF